MSFSNIDLSAIGDDGFIIQGDIAGDQAGTSVSSAGDVNGDGIDDIIIGAPKGNNGGLYAGEAYVVFGTEGVTRSNIDLTNLGSAGFIIQGDAPADLSSLGTAGFIIQGDAASDRAGYSVSSAGDVNGDGIDDLIVGAPNGDDGGITAGEAYVIFGTAGATRANVDLSSLGSAGFIIQGNVVLDYSGFSVSSAGDVNGDGFDDVIVSAHYGDPGGYSYAGQAYVVFGTAGATRANIDLSNLGDAGFTIEGEAAGDRAGQSVSAAGDINGDGIDDLIVGAPEGDDLGINSGESYVVYGTLGATRADVDLSSLGTDGFILRGDTSGDNSGYSVSAAGDVNWMSRPWAMQVLLCKAMWLAIKLAIRSLPPGM